MTSSRSESLVQMSTTWPYSGFSVPVHDPGVVAELAAHLLDDRAGGAADGVDGEAGEEERAPQPPMQQADEHVRVGDVDRRMPSNTLGSSPSFA